MQKKYSLTALLIFFSSMIFAQDWSDFKKGIEKVTNTNTNSTSASSFTENEAVQAIKEALNKGILNGVDKVSVVNGYLKNDLIKIPFPENARKVESTLRGIGLGSQVDKMIETLNHAAENAAKEAVPVFVSAIKQMTVKDAISIINNKQQDAATQFLQRTTTEQLVIAFKPSIKIALDKLNATKYWSDIMTQYNRIPFLEKVETDLPDYVTRKAISGLFVMVAQEEAKIRRDPGARTTEMLKKVFGNVKL
ncbi:MAG: hypothetical protein JWN78_1123 [Bacteroidota bacterium]|nr:hypothetical protein [Bacteroidota bacterium]